MSNMKRRRTLAAVGAAAVLSLVLGACGGEGGGTDEGTENRGAAHNAAVENVVNASDTKGGTIRFANPGDWDSLDPADTYYAYSWNFIRLYGRALVMFQPSPGRQGATLVPDLAESLGCASDGAKDRKSVG